MKTTAKTKTERGGGRRNESLGPRARGGARAEGERGRRTPGNGNCACCRALRAPRRRARARRTPRYEKVEKLLVPRHPLALRSTPRSPTRPRTLDGTSVPEVPGVVRKREPTPTPTRRETQDRAQAQGGIQAQGEGVQGPTPRRHRGAAQRPVRTEHQEVVRKTQGFGSVPEQGARRAGREGAHLPQGRRGGNRSEPGTPISRETRGTRSCRSSSSSRGICSSEE